MALISFDKVEKDPYYLNIEKWPDWQTQFNNDHPLKLEVGFGMGSFLIEMSAQEPKSNFIGMDFYHKGIRKLMTRVKKLQLEKDQLRLSAYSKEEHRSAVILVDFNADGGEIFSKIYDLPGTTLGYGLTMDKDGHIFIPAAKPFNILNSSYLPGLFLPIKIILYKNMIKKN